MKKMLPLMLVLAGCCGTDHVRLRSDKANLALAEQCAEGWFTGKPVSDEDKRLVSNALSDWRKRIAAEEAK
jgi:hypothetical protein